MTDAEVEAEIEALMTRDPNPASEIKDALRYARGDKRSQVPRWSPVNPPAIAEAEKDGPTLLERVSHSPEPIQFGTQSRTELFIDTLLPGSASKVGFQKNRDR
jgi:hypothetical protein